MVDKRQISDDSMTAFIILIETRQHLCKLQPRDISVGHDTLTVITQVKNHGCWLDSHLNMYKHVTYVCKSAFSLLHNTRSIKNYLSKENPLSLVHAFITSRLDYCNS